MGGYVSREPSKPRRKSQKSEFEALLELLVAQEEAQAEVRERKADVEAAKKKVDKAEEELEEANTKVRDAFKRLSPATRNLIDEMVKGSDSNPVKRKTPGRG